MLAAGLAIADERGLEALTMSAVADRLGVTAMALYRHVANKADLLDGLVERLLTEVPPPPGDLAWPERLTALARAMRTAAQRHPGVFPLVLQRPAATPAALVARRGVYEGLAEAGVAATDVAQVERIVSSAVLGFAASEAGGRFRHHAPSQIDADFEAMLRLLGLVVASLVPAGEAPRQG